MKIWQETDLPCQTIGFELTHLPGEKLILVVPELISDCKEVLLPWHHPSPKWDIGLDSARCFIEVDNVVRMDAEVLFHGEKIDIVVRVTNLSDLVWEKTNLFTCFAYYTSPLFDDPALTRTYFPIGEHEWKSVAELFAEHEPGDGPYTFFPVRSGPTLSELWVCRELKQMHSQVMSQGAACVLSKDGKWVAGMATQMPAYVFNNRRERCIHADPLLGTLQPGQTVQDVSNVYIFRGSLKDFDARLSE